MSAWALIRGSTVTDDCKTNQWLRSTRLKTETEGLINAAQDQDLLTKSLFARIVKDMKPKSTQDK